MWSVLAMARREREDPVPFYEHLAYKAAGELNANLAGARVLDLGCGPGHYTRALRRLGAVVVPVDLDAAEFSLPGGPPQGEIVGDAGRLPFPDGAFDGIFCSNLLEHTPNPSRVIDEIERCLTVGGWAWISWTNWFSPWGGHEITPFHLLGPRLGPAIHDLIKGPPAKNVPGQGLFPTYIGTILRDVNARPGFTLIRAVPRYYPKMRWIMKVPGLRELATWNCLIELNRI